MSKAQEKKLAAQAFNENRDKAIKERQERIERLAREPRDKHAGAKARALIIATAAMSFYN